MKRFENRLWHWKWTVCQNRYWLPGNEMKRSKTLAKNTERQTTHTRSKFRNGQGQCYTVRDDGKSDGNSCTACVTTLGQPVAYTELSAQSQDSSIINVSLRLHASLEEYASKLLCNREWILTQHVLRYSAGIAYVQTVCLSLKIGIGAKQISNCKPADLYLFTFLLPLQKKRFKEVDISTI
jgi:hypothetical protein